MEEWGDLVIFEKNHILKGSEKSITIYKTTSNTVNMAFSAALTRAIEEEYMILAYSKTKQAIVIFLNNEKEKNSYKLNKKPGRCTFPIQRFLNSFNLPKEIVVGKFSPKEDIVNDKIAWIIDLNERKIMQET